MRNGEPCEGSHVAAANSPPRRAFTAPSGRGAEGIAVTGTSLNRIHLDAESLAEGGVLAAYRALLPELKRFVPEPAPVEEIVDHDAPRYSIKCRGREYVIDAPGHPVSSWRAATFAFFDIVNSQLEHQEYRLFALWGGNDLQAAFLTPAQAEAARASLPQEGWPFLPAR
jgi:hypothetical protein